MSGVSSAGHVDTPSEGRHNWRLRNAPRRCAFSGAPSRRGMILVVVVGCLIFVSIIFYSMIDRVRHESAVTARTSTNENLYQLATAIGRLTIRKLQGDIETRDKTLPQNVFDAVFKGQTTAINNIDYSSIINKMDVVKEIVSQFTHLRGPLEIKVEYGIDMGTQFPFKEEFPGLERSNYERRGSINVEVTLTHKPGNRKYVKICKIKKEFFLIRLLAPPFHKFTLFCPRGAELSSQQANRLETDEEGILAPGKKPPLVLYNRLLRSKSTNQPGLDAVKYHTPNGIVNGNSFVQNAWIYLGGVGRCWAKGGRATKADSLILNMCSGLIDDYTANNFGYGEFFHFYYNPQSNGWLEIPAWTKWLNDVNAKGNPRIRDNAPDGKKMRVAVLNYGLFSVGKNGDPPLKDWEFNGSKLFSGIIRPPSSKNNYEVLTLGSSIRLWGTPSLCTPTLVFGPVKRRFLYVYSFFYPETRFVYPIPALPDDRPTFSNWVMQMESWRAAGKLPNRPPYNDTDLNDDIGNLFLMGELTYPIYSTGVTGTNICPIMPHFSDAEPYMTGLKTIAHPEDANLDWKNAFASNDYTGDKPDKLCANDYCFNNDKEIHYSGSINKLVPKADYLKDKMSYYIPSKKYGNPIKLSKCTFFDHFVDKTSGKNEVHLNQIIGFDGDLHVDMPLEVKKGGIIIVNGEITIDQPITNSSLIEPPQTPDCFGYITFISRKKIKINVGNPSPPFPQIHGYFICFSDTQNGEVEIVNPVHIIGGVAADKIDKLVDVGGIIEAGYEICADGTSEIGSGKDMTNPDFYGLALGPRDTEVVVED